MATNQARVSVIIEAKDQASAVLKGVKRSFDDMTPAFTAMATVGTAALGAIGAATYSSIKAAEESVKVQAQLGAVLKSTGNAAGLYAEDIMEQASALQRMTTYSDEAITSGANLLLTFTNIKGAIFQQALPAILDMSTALGQDLKSSAIQLGKALNDPIEGVTALRRVGVSFNEEQQQMIATLVETGQTMEAQKFILAELNREFGGSAAAAADTFAGKMEQLKIRIGDVQEEIGKALIPTILRVVDTVRPIVERMVEWATQNPELAKTILLVTGAVAALTAGLGLLGLALPAIVTGFTLLAGPLGLAVVAIAALGAGLFAASGHLNGLLTILDERTGLITLFHWAWKNIVQTFKESLLPALTELWESLQPLAPALALIAKIVGGALLVAITGVVLAITGWIQILTALVAMGTEVANVIIEKFVEPIEKFIKTVKEAVSWMSKLISKMNDVGVKSLGSKALSGLGDILGFEKGGIVPGPIGAPQLAVVHGGEMVIPNGRSSSFPSGINVTISGNTISSDLDMRVLADRVGREMMRSLKLTQQV